MLDGDLTDLTGHAPWSAVTPEIAATTLYHYDCHGRDWFSYPPGDWREKLLRLIQKSDLPNRLKLLSVYPGEVMACELAENENGIRALDTIARKVERSAT